MERIFSDAVYPANDSVFNAATAYSKAASHDSAKADARVVGRSSPSRPMSVTFPGKALRKSQVGATPVDVRTVKREGAASDLGLVTASSRRK